MVTGYPKDFFLEIFSFLRVSPNDDFNRVRASIASLDALRARFDDGRNQFNEALCEAETSSSDSQIDKNLWPSLVLLYFIVKF